MLAQAYMIPSILGVASAISQTFWTRRSSEECWTSWMGRVLDRAEPRREEGTAKKIMTSVTERGGKRRVAVWRVDQRAGGARRFGEDSSSTERFTTTLPTPTLGQVRYMLREHDAMSGTDTVYVAARLQPSIEKNGSNHDDHGDGGERTGFEVAFPLSCDLMLRTDRYCTASRRTISPSLTGLFTSSIIPSGPGLRHPPTATKSQRIRATKAQPTPATSSRYSSIPDGRSSSFEALTLGIAVGRRDGWKLLVRKRPTRIPNSDSGE